MLIFHITQILKQKSIHLFQLFFLIENNNIIDLYYFGYFIQNPNKLKYQLHFLNINQECSFISDHRNIVFNKCLNSRFNQLNIYIIMASAVEAIIGYEMYSQNLRETCYFV